MAKLIIKLKHFYYDYKYFNLILIFGIINICIFYDSAVVVDVEQNEDVSSPNDWSPSTQPTRYVEPYKGAVLVRYKDSTYYRLGLKPISRKTRCARQPDDQIPKLPTSTISPPTIIPTTIIPITIIPITIIPITINPTTINPTTISPTTIRTTTSILSKPPKTSAVPILTYFRPKPLPKCPLDQPRSKIPSKNPNCEYSETTTSETTVDDVQITPMFDPNEAYISGVKMAILAFPFVMCTLCSCYTYLQLRGGVPDDLYDPAEDLEEEEDEL